MTSLDTAGKQNLNLITIIENHDLNPITKINKQDSDPITDKQSNNPTADEQNPIAVPDEQNPIAVPDEQNPIAVPDEQNLNPITITSQEPNPITDVQQKVNSSWEEYRDNWNEEVLVTVNKPIIQFSDAYRNRMREKGLHPLNSEHARFMERLERMEEHCKAFPPASTVRYNVGVGYDNVLFNDEFELLECMVPKVSSTTWLELYIKMLGEDMHFEVFLPESHKIWKEISLVNKLGQKDTAKRYQTYTKFMITRNPFERLLSTYKSKFTLEGWYLEVIGPGIIRSNHLAGITDHEIARVKGELNRGGNSTSSLSDNQIAQIKRLSSGSRNFGITFLEFLSYVMTHNAASGREALDHHWAPATSICKPCAIRYDILAKFETLSEDSEAILDYVHATNSDGPIHFPLQKPKVNSNECKREFEKIPIELVRSLYQLYKDDFIIFGYEYNETENSFC